VIIHIGKVLSFAYYKVKRIYGEPCSIFMFHQATWNFREDTCDKLTQLIEESKIIDEQIVSIITKYTKDEYKNNVKELYHSGFYLSQNQAKDYGYIEEIIDSLPVQYDYCEFI
jgi:ATP-dependent protease ClpP protease subunit